MTAAPPPVLEVFYAPTCAPCRLELPAVAERFRHDTESLRIVIVSDDARARSDLAAVSPALVQATQPKDKRDSRAILRAAGDNDGILPYARSLSGDGVVCVSWRGPLTVWRINNLMSACADISARHLRRS